MEELINYFQTLFNDNSNPCIITEISSKEVVFVNLAMEKLLKEHNCLIEDMYNLTYANLKSNVGEDLCNDNLEEGLFVESHTYIEHFKRNYRITNTLLKIKDRKFNLCKYFLTPSYSNKQVSFDDSLNQAIDIFSKNDMENMSNEFLMLLGKFYQCEKSFVFFINKENNKLNKLYKWVKSNNITMIDDITDKMSIQNILEWVAQKDANGIIEANNLIEDSLKKKFSKDILFNFNISNLTLCVIEDENDDMVAAVGISNRQEVEFDYRLLKSITQFIKDGFNKQGMQQEIQEIAETDFLTGFYSRRKYIEVLSELEKNKPTKLGIIFVNINGLRRTNEYYGYEKGDEKIRNTAKIIKSAVNDRFFRISGDEFVCFVFNQNENDLLDKVNEIQCTLKNQDSQFFSVGYSWKEENDIDVLNLINEADAKMYVNKQDFYNENEV